MAEPRREYDRDDDGLIRLPIMFYRTPSSAEITMATKDLTALLLEKNGRILACGSLWDIESKTIGPGVYRVWLELRKTKENTDG